ncbi:MAG: Zn-dependent hydrolase [Aeromicrobium sp.]|nr:Zn-dependent hydrolase [Aeromicrobium sp.]
MDGMQITRHGHAAILVQAGDTRILIDPGMFCADETFALEGLSAIVLTHQHADHLDQERVPALLERNPDATLLGDPESAALLGGDWAVNADGLATVVGDVTIRGVGARHAEILPTIPRIANVGVLLSAGGHPTLFHPGDTYEHAPEGADVLALPLSAPWGKLSETVDFARRVAPDTYFPIHDRTVSEAGYGIYWSQVTAHAGVDDARRWGQDDTDTV